MGKTVIKLLSSMHYLALRKVIIRVRALFPAPSASGQLPGPQQADFQQ